MEGKKYPDGVYDFRSLVSGNYHFVDKTLMIQDICDADGKVLLYTRPRRFGKSINLSMLDYFFNIRYKDGPDLFSGLEIESCERCRKHRCSYPVIRMDFSRLAPFSSEAIEDSLEDIVSSVAMSVMATAEEGLLTGRNALILNRFFYKEASYSELNGSVAAICSMLEQFYGNKVMVLMDEYDHCVQNISSEQEYEAVANRIRPFIEQTFKTNYSMRTGVVTGIMPLTKAGMLSGFNNPVACDIFSTEGDELFGFTEGEVEKLLRDSGNDAPGTMDEIREWYDGYRFGNADVYNPYSVVRYLQSRSRGDVSPARKYWDGSTGAGMSSDLLNRMDGVALQELRSLYENPGYKVTTPLTRFLAYPDLFARDSDPAAVYSYLAMAGYLRADPTGERLETEDELYAVGMVNREIRPAFEKLVSRAAKRGTEVRLSLKSHMLSEDPALIRDDLQFILGGHAMDRSWSEESSGKVAHDKYKAAITAALRASGMAAGEEVPKGFGACDIFVPGNGKDRAIAVEIKTSSRSVPEALAEKAYKQIADKGYVSEPLDGGPVWIALGINGKRVSVISAKGQSGMR